MESEENMDFIEILERHRLIIAQKLQVDRSFLFDYLRDKGVFDSEDCEFVHAEKTREQRVGKFLDILSLKGRDAYEHFIDAIQQLSPSLYETLTGQKAGLNPNRTEEKDILGSNGSLDLDIITSHLKRTMQDLQEMTVRYDQVLRDKQEFNKNLKKTEMALASKQKRVEELERQREDSDELLSKAHGKAQRAEQGTAIQVSSLHRDLNERNTYIIALQMRLLASQEGIDGLREKLGEVTVQHDELLAKLKLISRDYQNQRRESMKLSERLAIQRDDIQKAEGIKLRIRELLFENQTLAAERDEAQNELNLVKDWTEALKARYDIVEEERKQTQHSHETVVADCSDLRDQSNELDIKLMIAKREIRDLSKRNADVEQSSSAFKEQRDFYANARKEAIEERDQARRERDKAVQRHTEVLNTRDQIINQQMEHSKHFETQYETVLAELQTAREQLAKTELEVEELKRVEVDRTVSNVGESTFVKPSRPNLVLQNPNRAANKEEVTPLPNVSPSNSSQSSDESFDWKTHRKTKDLIDSLKKRVKSEVRNPSPPSSGSENLEPHLNSSPTLDEKLEELMPQMKRLSPGAKQCFSLDRNKIHIKSFDTLAWMFEGTVGTNPHSFPLQMGSYCHPSKLFSQNSDASVPDLTSCSFESDAFEPPSDAAQNKENKVANLCRSEEPQCQTNPTKPPFVKSASSPPGVSIVKGEEESPLNGREEAGEQPKGNPNRWSLKDIANRPAYALASSIYSSEHPNPDFKDDFNLEEALKSPALRKPFRQRSGAKQFSEDERPSASAPISARTLESGCDATSKEDDTLSSQTDSKEGRPVVEPEPESEHTHEENSG